MTTFEELTEAEWDGSLDVFTGGLVGAVLAFRLHLGRGSSIVALSGTSAHSVVSSQHLGMGSAKAAVERAVTYLAAALAERGARVNAIACGPIETATIARTLDAEDLDRPRAWQSAVTVPGRLGQPADVGRIVAALCCPDLEWISWQVLLADGGAFSERRERRPATRSTTSLLTTARQRSCAASTSLNDIASLAAREPGPRVIFVRWRR